MCASIIMLAAIFVQSNAAEQDSADKSKQPQTEKSPPEQPKKLDDQPKKAEPTQSETSRTLWIPKPGQRRPDPIQVLNLKRIAQAELDAQLKSASRLGPRQQFDALVT